MKSFFISIYLILIVSLMLIAFGAFPITDELFEDQSFETTREIAKGTFSLVSERLLNLNEVDRQKELERLQLRFGYPLRLYKIEDFIIDPEDYSVFMKGEIIDDDEQDYVLIQRLGDTNTLITMGGPFPNHWLHHAKKIFFWGLCFIFLSLPALIWSYLLKRDMDCVEKSGARIMSGDHCARAAVSKVSSLFQISSFFNAMAGKFQRLLALQRELTNSVSHEIRTPLSRIQFSLEMLSGMDDFPEKGVKYLERITHDVDEIEILVDEMLTYAKLEGESAETIRFSTHDMVPWLSALIKQIQTQYPDKTIEFKSLPDLFSLKKTFEASSFERALRNLISNGLRHAESQVNILLEKQGDLVLIHVDDDGEGVSESDREKIFQPFFRVDDSRSRKSGGYGLGLAIVKRIMIRHDGTIEVSTSPLNGARFSLSF